MKEVSGERRYSLGLAVFEAKPPFRIVRMTPEPFDGGNFQPGGFKDIIFPCGAVLVGNQWVLSCGIQDQHSELRFYDFAEVEGTLRHL